MSWGNAFAHLVPDEPAAARPARKKPEDRTCDTSSEHREQVLLIKLVRFKRVEIPELDLLYAIPNGGDRNEVVAAKLKAEGVRAGVSDLHWPLPRHGYHGLWIEMKAGRNDATPEQQAWLERMASLGFATAKCWGWEAAWNCIMDYWRGEMPAGVQTYR